MAEKITDKETLAMYKSDQAKYSIIVNRRRAFPEVRDGLKPVQRKLIYGAHKKGLNHPKDQAGMAALSECLWNGEGTPRNRLEAIEWGSRSLAYPDYDSYPEYLLHRVWESLRDFAGSLRSFLTDMFE